MARTRAIFGNVFQSRGLFSVPWIDYRPASFLNKVSHPLPRTDKTSTIGGSSINVLPQQDVVPYDHPQLSRKKIHVLLYNVIHIEVKNKTKHISVRLSEAEMLEFDAYMSHIQQTFPEASASYVLRILINQAIKNWKQPPTWETP